jgi:HAD superfamily hydrolase (TIGR01509 family)
MIKAIIFDCFGVLVGKGFWKIYQDLGGDVEKDATFIEEMLDKANSGAISRQEFGHIIAEKINVSYEAYQEVYDRDEQPNEEIFSYIASDLKPNFKLAVVSNAASGSVERRITAQKMALFDQKIISADVKLLKPDPRIFQLALDRLGVTAEETVFTDDRKEYLSGAVSLGIHTILYEGPESFKLQLTQLLSDQQG